MDLLLLRQVAAAGGGGGCGVHDGNLGRSHDEVGGGEAPAPRKQRQARHSKLLLW